MRGLEAGLERGKKVKVIRVLKPTVKAGTGSERNYYVPIKEGWASWVLNRELIDDLKSKYSKNIYSAGKLGELIVETCDHKKSGWSWMSVDGPESIFCREILQKFFGDDVSDKRYCLYEMPETEGFLRKRKVIKNSH